MDVSSVLRPLLIAGLVLAEVGLWQWRMVIVYRGRRAGAMMLGAVGAVLQITAISQVVTYVSDPVNVAAYAAGVGLGILAGLAAGDRLSPGSVMVTIVTSDPDVAPRLWQRGWPVSAHAGHHPDGPVSVLHAAVSRRQEAELFDEVTALAPRAFVSTSDARVLNAGAHPAVRVGHLGVEKLNGSGRRAQQGCRLRRGVVSCPRGADVRPLVLVEARQPGGEVPPPDGGGEQGGSAGGGDVHDPADRHGRHLASGNVIKTRSN
jgi:uncharacterized protein YebE (UPF0316 family)